MVYFYFMGVQDMYLIVVQRAHYQYTSAYLLRKVYLFYIISNESFL